MIAFWIQKSSKITSQSNKTHHQSFIQFFTSIFGTFLQFWELCEPSLGTILASKTGYPFWGIPIPLRVGIFFALEAPRRPHSGSFLGPTSRLHRKNRYEMKVPIQKYRVLSIGLALPKRHFPPPSRTFLMVRAKSSFRIGKYDTKWTLATYACMNGAPWIRLAFKAIQVDFISVFVERIGPRLKRILTIYHKIRYELRVLGPKYRFLSIALTLRRSHFFPPSWTFPIFHVFLTSLTLVFKDFKVSFVF